MAGGGRGVHPTIPPRVVRSTNSLLPPYHPGYTSIIAVLPVLYILPLMVDRCTTRPAWAQEREESLGESLCSSFLVPKV